MNKATLGRVRTLPVAVTAIAFAISSAIASGAESPQNQQVRIQSGQIVTVNPGYSHTGSQPEATQLSDNVSYADLDLTTASGAAELENRIRERADSICKELIDIDPPGNVVDAVSDQRACVHGALDGAMPKAKQVIASAQEAKRHG